MRPLATDAATTAIASGDASIWPCPIIDAACSVPRRRVGDRAEERRVAEIEVWPSPSAAAASASSAWGALPRVAIIAVLHEFAMAVRSGMSPSALRRVVGVVLELRPSTVTVGVHGTVRRRRQAGPEEGQRGDDLERRPRGVATDAAVSARCPRAARQREHSPVDGWIATIALAG